MDDKQIIQLYFDRSEDAITQTASKYGRYCHTIAYNILHNFEDSEECVNDTYWKAWRIIPPRRPKRFAAFLGKITRNLSLDIYRHYTADKRGVCNRFVVYVRYDRIYRRCRCVFGEKTRV